MILAKAPLIVTKQVLSFNFKIVSNFTRLMAREMTYNNLIRNISRGIYAKYQHKSCYYLYKFSRLISVYKKNWF